MQYPRREFFTGVVCGKKNKTIVFTCQPTMSRLTGIDLFPPGVARLFDDEVLKFWEGVAFLQLFFTFFGKTTAEHFEVFESGQGGTFCECFGTLIADLVLRQIEVFQINQIVG